MLFGTMRLIALTLAGICVSGCRDNIERKGGDNTSTPVTLQLKWLYNAGFSGDLVAHYRKLWPGLDVSVREGGPAINPVNAVVSGQAEFGVTSGDQLLLARENGAPIVAIALAYRRNPLVWITRTSDSISSGADLRGRAVGLTYIDDEPLYRAWLRRVGLNPERDVRTTRVQFDLTPFTRAEVAAFPVFINTQGVELANRLGQDSVSFIGPEGAGIQSYSNLYFTTTKMIKERPEVVARFVEGVKRGWEFAADSPAVAAGIVSQYDRTTPPEVVRQSVEATNQLVQRHPGEAFGLMTSDGWRSTHKILREAGTLKSDLQVQDVFTTQFVASSDSSR